MEHDEHDGVAGSFLGISISLISHPIVLLCAAIVPCLLTPFAPIIDAPNHLARIWLEAQNKLTGVQAQAYIVDWNNTSSNYMVDVLSSHFLHIGSLQMLVTIMLAVMVVGTATGVLAVAGKLYGRISIFNCLVLAGIWGQSLASGFINYHISLAVAIWLFFAYYVLAREKDGIVPVIFRVLAILITYLFHPFGIILFAGLDFALIYGPKWRPSLSANIACLRQFMIGYLLPFAILLIYFFLHLQNNPVGKFSIKYGDFISHLVSIGSPFFSYHEIPEIILTVPAAAVIVYTVIRHQVSVHIGLLLVAASLGIGALLIPDIIGDGAWLTRRLPFMGFLVLFLALSPHGVERPVVKSVLALAILAHCAWIGWVWHMRSGDYEDLQIISTSLPDNSKVIVARNPGLMRRWIEPGKYVHGPHYTRRHLPALLVPLAHAYIPTLFSIRGQQPLRIAPAFQHLSSPSSAIPTIDELQSHQNQDNADPYLAHWECDFDYLLVLEQDQLGRRPENFVGADLVKVTASERLYRLQHCHSKTSGRPV